MANETSTIPAAFSKEVDSKYQGLLMLLGQLKEEVLCLERAVADYTDKLSR
jgi:hypothetical protein